MIDRRNLTAIALVVIAVVRSSSAAVPRDSIRVVFQNDEPVSEIVPSNLVFEGIEPVLVYNRGYEPGTLRYQLGFGDEFWQPGHRLRICRPAYVAESINLASRERPTMRILLDVPGKTKLSTIAEAVNRLKYLAAANAIEYCQVEIFVFRSTPIGFGKNLLAGPTNPTAAPRQATSSKAAGAKNGGSAVFRDKLAVVRAPNIGNLGYHLTTDGNVCSDAGMPLDVEIAEAIDSLSRLYRSLCISLEVDDPHGPHFSDILAAIEHLDDLAAANAIDHCTIEIVVFTTAPRAPNSDLSAAP